jgi:hypothetical protein
MRCCALPTTSSAADPRVADERRAAEQIAQAVLFREVLKPLAEGLGPVGELAAANVADTLFARRVVR